MIRTLSAERRADVVQSVQRVATHVAAAHGLTLEFEHVEGYPVTVNDEGEYAFAKDTIVDLFGPDRYVHQRNPEMGAEDFAFVGQEVPSADPDGSA